MREVPLDDGGTEISAVAHDAAHGHVVYLTAHGQPLAAIAPAEFAWALAGMTTGQVRELLEDLADGAPPGRLCTSRARTSLPGRPGRAWSGVTGPGRHLRAGVPACRCVRSASSAGRQPGGSRLPSKGCAMTRARPGPGCSLVIHRPATV
jgi:antitoxin (DNA-binding transcriptional repressor) of toxin-antitoxin stability system